jgi:hypothetical protein
MKTDGRIEFAQQLGSMQTGKTLGLHFAFDCFLLQPICTIRPFWECGFWHCPSILHLGLVQPALKEEKQPNYWKRS